MFQLDDIPANLEPDSIDTNREQRPIPYEQSEAWAVTVPQQNSLSVVCLSVPEQLLNNQSLLIALPRPPEQQHSRNPGEQSSEEDRNAAHDDFFCQLG